MNNKDTLQRFLFENAPIRGEVVHLNQSFQTIMQQHDYPPLIARLLGEALVMASLLTAIIKFKGQLTVQFQGKDKLKLLLAQCDDQLHLRGLVQWTETIEESELLGCLQKGLLVITIDPEASGKRYQGIVGWYGNSLAQAIEGYFRNSEQLQTRIWVAVDDKIGASGLLLQEMPVEETKEISASPSVEWENVTYLTETITPEELLTLDTETLLHRLYVEEDVRLFESIPIIFQCTCSTKKSENAILLLGQQEIEQELQAKPMIEVVCDFCNKKFTFDRVDIARIFREYDGPSASTPMQ